MINRLNEKQLKLYNAIDEILWNDWDPLGMKYSKGPRDEYGSYVPIIFSLKIHRADTETIALKLIEIESKTMGMDHGYENCRQVAEKIFNLYL